MKTKPEDFIRINDEGEVYGLCGHFKDTPYELDWGIFWSEINTQRKIFMTEYFNKDTDFFERGLLRLLILQDFKQYLKEKKK